MNACDYEGPFRNLICDLLIRAPWVESDHPMPSKASFDTAQKILCIADELDYLPHLTTDHRGAICLEWWNDISKRALLLCVLNADVEFVKSWGPHLIYDMDNGIATQIYEMVRWVKEPSATDTVGSEKEGGAG